MQEKIFGSKIPRWLGWLLVIVLAWFMAAGIIYYTSPSATKGTTWQQRQGNSACSHFVNVRSDWQQGLLTRTELREKLKEVYEKAVDAEPEIKEATTNAMQVVTFQDSNLKILFALGGLADACVEAGFSTYKNG